MLLDFQKTRHALRSDIRGLTDAWFAGLAFDAPGEFPLLQTADKPRIWLDAGTALAYVGSGSVVRHAALAYQVCDDYCG